MYKVYGDIYSGNCYKVKLLMQQLGKDHEWKHIDIMEKENRTQAFLDLNPTGKIPLLETPDGLFLSESNAILLHLSEGTSLQAEEKWQRAKVYQWLFFEQYSHEPYVAVARFLLRYLNQSKQNNKVLDEKLKAGYKALSIMENQLKTTPYLTGDQYTIADIALYAYTHVAHEGGFDLKPYKKIRKWLKRVAKQADYVSMEQADAQMKNQ